MHLAPDDQQAQGRRRDVLRCREAVRRDVLRWRHRLLKFLERHGRDPLLAHVRGNAVRAQAGAYPPGRAGEGHRRCGPPVGWLRCFRGIDALSAMTLVADIVDFQRFQGPSELMAYVGLVPNEYFRERLNTAAPSMHGERLWKRPGSYRHRRTVGAPLAARRQGQPRECLAHLWRAQQRLDRRYQHLVGHGNRPPVPVTVIARETRGLHLGSRHPSPGSDGVPPRGKRHALPECVARESSQARLESPRACYATPDFTLGRIALAERGAPDEPRSGGSALGNPHRPDSSSKQPVWTHRRDALRNCWKNNPNRTREENA